MGGRGSSSRSGGGGSGANVSKNTITIGTKTLDKSEPGVMYDGQNWVLRFTQQSTSGWRHTVDHARLVDELPDAKAMQRARSTAFLIGRYAGNKNDFAVYFVSTANDTGRNTNEYIAVIE